MSGQRLTDKTQLTGNTALDDLYMIVDESDNTGSGVGTSKKIQAEQVIQTTKVSVTATNFANMDDDGAANSSVNLLPAAGTGNFYVILAVTINTNVVTAPTNNTNLYVGYDAAQIAEFVLQFRRFSNTLTSRSYNIAPMPMVATGGDLGTLTTKALKLYSNQNFNGSFSADVYVTYRKCSII